MKRVINRYAAWFCFMVMLVSGVLFLAAGQLCLALVSWAISFMWLVFGVDGLKGGVE